MPVNAAVALAAVVSNGGTEPIFTHPLNIFPNTVTLAVLKNGTV
jgi:hypothetical protein